MRSLVPPRRYANPSLDDARARFLEHTIPEPNSGCLLWIGGTFADGYGCFVFGKLGFKNWRANRASLWLLKGKFDRTLCVLHRCDNKHCVNPDHLFLGTHTDNSNDKVAKKRHLFGERHHKAKLSNEEIIKIRSDSRTNRKIALQYKMDPTTIGAIKRRKIWGHI